MLGGWKPNFWEGKAEDDIIRKEPGGHPFIDGCFNWTKSLRGKWLEIHHFHSFKTGFREFQDLEMIQVMSVFPVAKQRGEILYFWCSLPQCWLVSTRIGYIFRQHPRNATVLNPFHEVKSPNQPPLCFTDHMFTSKNTYRKHNIINHFWSWNQAKKYTKKTAQYCVFPPSFLSFHTNKFRYLLPRVLQKSLYCYKLTISRMLWRIIDCDLWAACETRILTTCHVKTPGVLRALVRNGDRHLLFS